jgi:hypothetical protein
MIEKSISRGNQYHPSHKCAERSGATSDEGGIDWLKRWDFQSSKTKLAGLSFLWVYIHVLQRNSASLQDIWISKNLFINSNIQTALSSRFLRIRGCQSIGWVLGFRTDHIRIWESTKSARVASFGAIRSFNFVAAVQNVVYGKDFVLLGRSAISILSPRWDFRDSIAYKHVFVALKMIWVIGRQSFAKFLKNYQSSKIWKIFFKFRFWKWFFLNNIFRIFFCSFGCWMNPYQP